MLDISAQLEQFWTFVRQEEYYPAAKTLSQLYDMRAQMTARQLRDLEAALRQPLAKEMVAAAMRDAPKDLNSALHISAIGSHFVFEEILLLLVVRSRLRRLGSLLKEVYNVDLTVDTAALDSRFTDMRRNRAVDKLFLSAERHLEGRR